jgi:hypothetical protein
VASTMARMGPSTPAHPRVLGASIYAIWEVTGRAAKPMLLVLTHRARTLGGPRLVHRPVDDALLPFREATRIAVGKTSLADSPHSRLAPPV